MRARALIGLAVGLAVWLVPPVLAQADEGSWNSPDGLSISFTEAAAATLTDGRVLVVGGYDQTSHQALAQAEFYNPATNGWARAAPLPVARAGATAVSLPGDRILVVGGVTTSDLQLPPEVYDAETNRWSQTAPLPFGPSEGAFGPLAMAAAPLSDGRALVLGNGGAAIYNATRNTWSYAALPGNGATEPPGLAPLSDGDVLLTNENADFASGGAEVYAPTTNTWSFTSQYFIAPEGWDFEGDAVDPAGPGVLLDDGLTLVVGANGDAEDATLYNTASGGWAPAAQLPGYQDAASQPAAIAGDRAFILNPGLTGGTEVEIYTPPATAPAVTPTAAAFVDGQPISGQTLSATGGTDGPYRYQWQRCLDGICHDVGPLTAPSWSPALLTLGQADVGFAMRFIALPGSPGAAAETSPKTSFVQPWLISGGFGGSMEADHPQLGTVWVSSNFDGPPVTVRYRIAPAPHTAPELRPVTGTVVIPDGVGSAAIPLPSMIDHGVGLLTRAISVTLQSTSSGTLASPTTGLIHVCVPYDGCGPWPARDPADPLELSRKPPTSDLLRGAHFFVDASRTPAAHAATAMQRTDPSGARALRFIASVPSVARFGKWSGAYPGRVVASFLQKAQKEDPGSLPLLATYRIVDGHCGHYADPPSEQAAYRAWITNFAEGIGERPAVLFLEMDSIITAQCLTPAGLNIRMAELSYAVHVLSECPHLLVYLDAGAADAAHASRVAALLRRADVAQARGFFLNSTHFDWTLKEIRYGQAISRLLGGKHFIVNTAENGQGPLVPKDRAKDGNEVLCDPPGRGLGPLPTADTGYRDVDAFAWIAHPGVSGGPCRPGAPKSGVFWPKLAISLFEHRDFKVR